MEGTGRSVWRCWFRVNLINLTVPNTSRTYRYQFQLDWCYEPKLIKDPALEQAGHIISPSVRCQMSALSLETRRNMWPPHSIDKVHPSCSPEISAVPLAAISDTAGRADLPSPRVSQRLLTQLRETPLSLWASPCPSLFLTLQQLPSFSPGAPDFLRLPNPNSTAAWPSPLLRKGKEM